MKIKFYYKLEYLQSNLDFILKHLVYAPTHIRKYKSVSSRLISTPLDVNRYSYSEYRGVYTATASLRFRCSFGNVRKCNCKRTRALREPWHDSRDLFVLNLPCSCRNRNVLFPDLQWLRRAIWARTPLHSRATLTREIHRTLGNFSVIFQFSLPASCCKHLPNPQLWSTETVQNNKSNPVWKKISWSFLKKKSIRGICYRLNWNTNDELIFISVQ